MERPREVVLEARHITKRYPGNTALDGVSFRAYRGSVNVLIGENGAGKSTLMRVLSGVEAADSGEIWMEGRRIVMESPRDATAQGIAIVHQELSVLTNLDVSENIFAGRELTRQGGMVDRDSEDRRAAATMLRLRMPVGLETRAGRLALGCRQVLEIGRALAHRSKVLILDEPTSALSMTETETLFGVIAELLESGMTIIYISHRLGELMRLGDYFTVLRSGVVVGESVRGEVTREWIVETMSGRSETDAARERRREDARVVLDVRELNLQGRADEEQVQAPLHDVSFALHEGEILGVYGLLGAGRTELLECLAGCREPESGVVKLKGRELRLDSVTAVTEAGMVLVPEDRQHDGLVPELSVRENIVLAAAGERWLSRAKETERVQQMIRKLRIVVRDVELPVTALSGGNQQKVLLARCLMRKPAVLLLDEPTRGVDANAKLEIYRVLRELADEGLSILFTSSEIEETERLADRAMVLCQGRVAAVLDGDEIKDVALFSAASPLATTVEAEIS
jgi:erythritol transport system ATP-binding protein